MRVISTSALIELYTEKNKATHEGVEGIVGCLDQRRIPIQESRAEKANFLDRVRLAIDDNTIANVEGMLDEQEDDTRQNLLQTSTNKPTETQDECTSTRDQGQQLSFL